MLPTHHSCTPPCTPAPVAVHCPCSVLCPSCPAPQLRSPALWPGNKPRLLRDAEAQRVRSVVQSLQHCLGGVGGGGGGGGCALASGLCLALIPARIGPIPTAFGWLLGNEKCYAKGMWAKGWWDSLQPCPFTPQTCTEWRCARHIPKELPLPSCSPAKGDGAGTSLCILQGFGGVLWGGLGGCPTPSSAVSPAWQVTLGTVGRVGSATGGGC